MTHNLVNSVCTKSYRTNQLISLGMFNPYMANGLAHHYQLGESTFILRDIRSDFAFLFHFWIKFLSASRIAPDGTPRSRTTWGYMYTVCHSHKKDARLK